MALRIRADREKFKELYEAGVPVAEIAIRLTVSRQTVYNYLDASGVVVNPRNGGRKKVLVQGEEGGAIA